MSELEAHRGEHLARSLREWAADQRERESWKDADRSTYHFRAMVLEGALAELDALRAQLAEAQARAEKAERERDEAIAQVGALREAVTFQMLVHRDCAIVNHKDCDCGVDRMKAAIALTEGAAP